MARAITHSSRGSSRGLATAQARHRRRQSGPQTPPHVRTPAATDAGDVRSGNGPERACLALGALRGARVRRRSTTTMLPSCCALAGGRPRHGVANFRVANLVGRCSRTGRLSLGPRSGLDGSVQGTICELPRALRLKAADSGSVACLVQYAAVLVNSVYADDGSECSMRGLLGPTFAGSLGFCPRLRPWNDPERQERRVP
jgi:hypothetical protein